MFNSQIVPDPNKMDVEKFYCNMREIRMILGKDFIIPEEVPNYGSTYSDEQLACLAETIPDLETVNWLRENHHVLVCTPVADTNLLGVRSFDNQLFYSKQGGWYAEDRQKFARTDVVKGGQWLMFSKGAAPNLFWSKNLPEKRILVTAGQERVPNAAEVSYGMTLYRKVRGINLLPDFYVRTSSIDVNGNQVYVGGQGYYGGLYVGSIRSDANLDILGVSSARN